jgi:hypothetical protein
MNDTKINKRALKSMTNEIHTLRRQLATAERERDELRAGNLVLTGALADAMRAVPESDAVLIGELIDIIRDFGHGDDTPEYKRALELIGAVPVGDMSEGNNG